MNAAVPAAELAQILEPALAPCPHFAALRRACPLGTRARLRAARLSAEPPTGPGAVRLVLATAESTEPDEDDAYSGTPGEMLEAAAVTRSATFAQPVAGHRERPAPFHRNLRRILDFCWPGDALEAQLAKTWIAPAVLCSAPSFGMPIPRAMETACIHEYFRREIEALGDVFIIALGAKAHARLERGGSPRVHRATPERAAGHETRGELGRQRHRFRAWLAARNA